MAKKRKKAVRSKPKPKKAAEVVVRSEAAERQTLINPGLAGLVVPIETLKLDPENARLHDKRNLEAIAFSLKNFGQQKPVVVTQGGIVAAGNGMVEAARDLLGWTEIAAVVLPFDDVLEARAYALADNRTAELSVWDDETLSACLRMLKEQGFPEVGSLGWTGQELDLLIHADWKPRDPSDGGLNSDHGGKAVKLSHDQFEIVMQAVTKVRERENDPDMEDGRCLELICADFIAGP